MSGSYCRVVIVGNLGRDPEIRNSTDGNKILNMTVATSETWTKNGERQTRTEWHRIVSFNDRIADVAERFLKKGSRCLVEGTLQTRKWTDSSGVEKYSTEVVIGKFDGKLVLLDSRSGSDGEGTAAPQKEAPQNRAGKQQYEDMDDSIPF